MSFEIILVLAILGLAFVLFVSEALPIDVTALAVLGILLITGLIEPADSIKGFSNPAVITIAGLFILSHALKKSGVLEYIAVRLIKIGNRSRLLGLTAYLITIAIASALVNNTAIVAIFMPITIRLAVKFNISPSKILIPLSYAAILGGTLTLVGTSTNLLVNSIITVEGEFRALGMFEFSRYGIFQLLVGLLYIIAVAYRILPSRTITSSLTKSYHMGGYLTEVKIKNDSPLIGKSCVDRGLSQNYDIIVLDIVRDKKLITVNVQDTKLKEGDILFVRGSLDDFLRMKELEKVTLLTDEKLTDKELVQQDNILVECLLTDRSDLVGKSLMDSNFRRRFGSFVLAIRREGTILRKKIAHIVLNSFDTLLVYGAREKIQELGSTSDFIVLEEIETALKKHRFWWLATFVIVSIVLLAAFQILPILTGTIIGVVAALIGESIFKLLLLFPGSIRPTVLLAIIYLITMILTEVSSNAATAILMTPIALAASAQLGIDPRPYIFAICFAASASFITPVGYQTNLMVYGPGGYKFTDFMRTGTPLALVLWIMAIFLIPILWPFQAT
jgi:di/tricarboxylate transporter